MPASKQRQKGLEAVALGCSGSKETQTWNHHSPEPAELAASEGRAQRLSPPSPHGYGAIPAHTRLSPKGHPSLNKRRKKNPLKTVVSAPTAQAGTEPF